MLYYAVKLTDKKRVTPEGYLIYENVPIARTGAMTYMRTDSRHFMNSRTQTVEAYTEANELFNDRTIASFNLKPVTIGHPESDVTKDNWQDLAHGIVVEPKRKGDELIADIMITNAEAIKAVNAGQKELSCGYDADIENRNGKYYKKNIIGNHVAIVPNGRAGTTKLHDKKGENMDYKKFGETIAKALGLGNEKMADECTEKKEEMKDADPVASEMATMKADIASIKEMLSKMMQEEVVETESEKMADEAISAANILVPGFEASSPLEVLKEAEKFADKKAVIDRVAAGQELTEANATIVLNATAEIIKQENINKQKFEDTSIKTQTQQMSQSEMYKAALAKGEK